MVDKDTRLCMSLAGTPSNNGTRFHNFLYRELGLNFVYKAFTTNDLAAAIGGIRALGIRGCGVSMPYKEDCIEHLDELEDSAQAIQSVNTIVNDDGHLRGFNTDYLAIVSLLRSHEVPADSVFAVHGSGGMAKAVVAALRDSGFATGAVIARNEVTGRALADRYGYSWLPGPDALTSAPDVLVNATPLGMAGEGTGETLSFPRELAVTATTVFDVVATPAETPLVRTAREAGRRVITGAEVVTLQALEQFVLYTGLRPDDELVAQASAFARANL